MWHAACAGGPRKAARWILARRTWARYTARVGVEYARRILQGVATGRTPTTPAALFRSFTGTLYDLRPMLASTVGQRSRDMCLGLQVMLGGRGSPSSPTWPQLGGAPREEIEREARLP